MRLQRGTLIAGLDPEIARFIARCCSPDWTSLGYVAHRLKVSDADAERMLLALAAEGYLTRRDEHAQEWKTTIPGNALAMASFLKPINRKKAQSLLDGLLERARAYNGDDAKPLLITRLMVFGSFCDPNAETMGDLDISVAYEDRRPEWRASGGPLKYGRASGRSFSTFTEMICWSQVELLRILRNRSGYLNVSMEDVPALTDRYVVVFERDSS